MSRNGPGALAESAVQILGLTRDLLRQASLGYIEAAEPDAPPGGGFGSLGSVHDAFADAAMMWAKIVASCLVMADSLLSQGRLAEVRSLAAALGAAGESDVAQELRQRLADAETDRYKKSLGKIHAHMTVKETEEAIMALNEALANIPESPQRDYWLNSFLPALATSAVANAREGIIDDVQFIASGGRMSYPQIVADSISVIDAAFRAAVPRSQ